MKRILKIRVFTPGNEESELLVHRPAAGKKFTSEGITGLLKNTWRDINVWFPEHDYKLVSLGANEYNFVCIGEKLSQDRPLMETATA